jgi:DNA polymerase (family 10)
MDNYQIADTFSLLAKIMDIHGENSFKTKTYSNAAFQLEKVTSPIMDMAPNTIAALKGVGESTAKKIIELLQTGKLSVLEEYISNTPSGVLEMLHIKGIGPKKINTIWKEMELESVGELLYACNENRLTLYKGFGEKTQENVRTSIEYYLSQQGFFLYKQAETFANFILPILQTEFPQSSIFFTGDYLRHSETLETLELVTDISIENLKNTLGQIVGMHFSLQEEEVLTYRMENGPNLKIYSTPTSQLQTRLFETSGSKTFVDAFHNQFPDISFKDIEKDEQIFEQCGAQYIPYYLREDDTIIEKAKQFAIPTLIQTTDIKGIVHSHSTWSDGTHTLLQMATAAKEQGFEYLAISDHSRSAGYANGLTVDRILQQHAEIDNINKQLAPFKIFKSIESDILIDGSLDYSDGVLASFDLVIASVHSVLKMTEEKAMARLIKAIENPYTTILGHMTGRLLLSRSGYPVNHHTIIDACAANGVVIELNAHPRRLDIDWRWIPYALNKNVLISIDPDAHAIEGFADIKYGVLAAQKGLLTAQNNLSSFSLLDFENYLQSKRK